MRNGDLTVYRGCTSVIDAEYNGDRPPTEAIIEAVATASGVDPLDLPPIYEFVDPDALNTFFDRHTGAPNAVLGFEIETWNVFVRADGKIKVCDSTRPVDPKPVFEDTSA